MTDGNFLCGCSPTLKANYSGEGNRYDEAGFLVCPEHGERLYGWKSHDPNQPHYISNGVGMPPTFKSPAAKVGFEIPEMVDRRDNRDPELVGQAVLTERRKKRAGTNGHA